MPKHFNEDSRVKIPTILHLTQLGYTYVSLKTAKWDKETNVFPDLFQKAMQRINPESSPDEIQRLYDDAAADLQNEDLGKAFYKRLVSRSGMRLLDLEDFDNNSFHVCTELTYANGDDNFRPDITCLINGMPLVFIEVKKPNNREGVKAELMRMERRSRNKKLWPFMNITQFMLFSNNMKYDPAGMELWQGAFYAAPSYSKPIFNYFREEIGHNLTQELSEMDPALELEILKDTNYPAILNSKEYQSNKSPNTPTNELVTNMLSRKRLQFFLQHSIAFVKQPIGPPQKHIMRYPQFFATKAIEAALDEGKRKGIIWHTQGSGKTALAYYNTHFLTHYYQQRGIVPKFYFIVDRLDLLTQARNEFTDRGLKVHTVNSRDEFMADLKLNEAVSNDSGQREITVVNIQKFKDEPHATKSTDYNLQIQRVYFLDEVHRSYNPEGSFLANLEQSDKNAIKIGLTGTPLIGESLKSKHLFGEYIHKYYYDSSIADGYTLKLIREDIETKYRMQLQQILEQLDIRKGDADLGQIYAHHSYVSPLLDYIVNDLERFRIQDKSVGGMVICHSSNQARAMHELFQKKYAAREQEKTSPDKESIGVVKEPDVRYDQVDNTPMAAQFAASYQTPQQERSVKKAALILYDAGSKQELEDRREEFKKGDIDLLFVYNMLLTGFDAKRLKKLYLGRVIKSHNLLQALTRVNRTYKDHRYGYVVDFADISKEFDKTNAAYFRELQDATGTEADTYSNLFMSREDMVKTIGEIKNTLGLYDLTNAKKFTDQINEIYDREPMLELVKALDSARSLYNVLRLTGEYELLKELDFNKLNTLRIEAANRLTNLNVRSASQRGEEVQNMLQYALEDIFFSFNKLGEQEMILGDKLKDLTRKAREAMVQNFDTKDPEYITLYEELRELLERSNATEFTQDELRTQIKTLNEIHRKVKELNRRNNLLKDKYLGDPKYARVHKRIMETGKPSQVRTIILEALQKVKAQADQSVLQRNDTLSNENYFTKQVARMVNKEFGDRLSVDIDYDNVMFVSRLIVREYMDEYYNKPA